MTEKKSKKTKNTQDEIEAALAAATGTPMNPSAPKREVEEAELGVEQPPNVEQKNPYEPWNSKENLDTSEAKDAEKDDSQEEVPDNAARPIAMSTEDFGRRCFNLDIDAKQCNYQSNKSKDKTIDEYLRGINKKIYDETRSGGYSTNIQFRVAPNDYVNVNHIIDWYKARGFQILNYNMGTAPYGANAGMMEHNFTISWTDV